LIRQINMPEPAPSFQPHPVEWTHQKVARFWDFLATNEGAEYFSAWAAQDILRRSLPRMRMRPELCLDFGCGPGFLLEELARQNIQCEGVEFSAETVQRARDRLSASAKVRGVHLANRLPTDLPADNYDAVFLIETLEHLLPADVDPTLAELYRLTRPGGHVVVTTPNEEQLAASTVICPDCGCTFHQVQHISSWTASGAAQRFEAHGFATIVSEPCYLARPTLVSRMFVLAWRLVKPTLPHLLYVGRKPAH
jgi:SAM-dependent methyltransferase